MSKLSSELNVDIIFDAISFLMASLRNSLDRTVYQIVLRLEQGNVITSPVAVYDHIKTSNSSIARQKRKPLEESIDRVLAIRKRERSRDDVEYESSDAAIERAMEEREKKPGVCNYAESTRIYMLMTSFFGNTAERRISPESTDGKDMEYAASPRLIRNGC